MTYKIASKFCNFRSCYSFDPGAFVTGTDADGGCAAGRSHHTYLALALAAATAAARCTDCAITLLKDIEDIKEVAPTMFILAKHMERLQFMFCYRIDR